MEETLAHGKRMALIGALLLWVATPILMGALITVGARYAGHRHHSALAYFGLLIGGGIVLVVMFAGFGNLMAGVYLWWRSRNTAPIVRTARPRESTTDTEHSSASTAKSEMLADMRSQLRGDEAPSETPAGQAVSEPSSTDPIESTQLESAHVESAHPASEEPADKPASTQQTERPKR